MKKEEEINNIKKKITPILKRHSIKKAGIFGSYARGEQKRGSDVDIIIEPTKNMGLEFFGLCLELEKKLRRRVDILTYKSIHPYLKKYIMEDEIRII
jgi:hypothetical protein